MSVKEEKIADAEYDVSSTHTIKIERISPEREDQFSCSLIKVEKDSEDDTDAVSTHDRYEYILEIEVKKEEPCEIPKEDAVTKAQQKVKVEIDIGPTEIETQNIYPSAYTASKVELIQCGGADVTLGTTTPDNKQKQSRAGYMREYRAKMKQKEMQNTNSPLGSKKSKPPPKSSTERWRKFIAKKRNDLQQAISSGAASHRSHKKEKRISKGNAVAALQEEKPFSCDICQLKFKMKAYLVPHMRIHTGEKPYSCNICQYKCGHKSSLVKHTRTHTGEKPFTCNICQYKWADKSSLVKHIRVHTGEKPFSCSLCEYKCADKSSLVKHLRIHTGEKPFSCSICEYKCAVKSSLVKHIKRTHSRDKTFLCNICEYKCSFKSDLVKHIHKSSHIGEYPVTKKNKGKKK